MKPDVAKALTAYRIMAGIVGVLLIVLVLIGLPLHYGYLIHDEGWLAKDTGGGYKIGTNISAYLGVAHGWLYMIFLFCAFWLSRKAKWELGFTVVTLLCGTIPVLSFWAERRATALTRGQFLINSGNDASPTTEVTHG